MSPGPGGPRRGGTDRSPSFRWSRAIFRVLLTVYPTGFRRRFGKEMQDDFRMMLAARGRVGAWWAAARDLGSSVPDAHAQARARRRVEPRRQVAPRRRVEQGLVTKGDSPMGSLLFDLKHAARRLMRAPVFTAITVLTLALGIGANSAIFSLVNTALLRPLGFDDPDRLVFVHEGIPQANMPRIPGSAPDILDLREYQKSFSALAAYRGEQAELSGTTEPRRVAVTRAEAGLFPLLGASPMLGRTFAAEDDTPGHDVAILGYGLWQSLFGGRPDAVGSVVKLDRRPYTIVGVMPASFEFPRRGAAYNATPAELYVPMAWTDFERGARGSMFNNSVIARLAPGVTLAQAAAEMKDLGPRIGANYPAAMRRGQVDITLTAKPLRDELAGRVRTPLLVLFAAVGLVLLVACANVANLILSRAVSRQHELSLRLALGAPRRRLLQLLLCESVLLAAAGGALGLLAGRAALDAIPAVLATSLPGVDHAPLDGRVLTFTLVMSALTAIVFGLIPLFTTDRRLAATLHEAGARATGGRAGRRLQQGLVVATVGFAVILLVGAGLLLRSFAGLVATDPGFSPDRVLTMSVSLPIEAYPQGTDVTRFIRSLHERFAALPGLRAVTLSTDVPLESNEQRAMTPENAATTGALPSVALTWTYGDYFGALGVPIRRGRTFNDTEDEAIRPVAIVSESLARRFWPGQDAVGKRIKNGIAASPSPWLEIVGVAGDAHDGALGAEPTIHVYLPWSHIVPDLDALTRIGNGFGRTLRIALLVHGDPAAIAEPARREIAALDPALPVTRIATMAQQVAASVAPQRFSTLVLGVFAAGALLLAAIGLYGVLAFSVAQRTREIGVRIALGATPGGVLGMVVRQGMRLVAVGIGLGLVAAAAATRVMTSLLYRTAPYDPWTFATVPLALAAVALVACWVPGRRAARVEPIVALRAE